MNPENPAFADEPDVLARFVIPVDPPSRARRVWRWLRWVLLVVAVKLVLLAVWEYYWWQATWNAGDAKLQPLVAELDATDPDWRAAELCAKRNAALPPREANAAEVALQAAKLAPESYKAWSGKEKWREKLTVGQLPRQDDLAELAPVLADCKPAIEQARKARQFPGGGLPLTFAEPSYIETPLPDIQSMRTAGDLLTLASLSEAVEGKQDASVGSATAVLTVSRSVGDEPFCISQLVRVAVAVRGVRALELAVGLGESSDAALREWQAAADAESRVPRFAYGLRGERAGFHRLLENLGDGTLWPDQVTGRNATSHASVWGKLKYSSLTKHVPAQQATALDFFNRALAAAEMPHGPERAAKVAAVEDELQALPKATEMMFVRLLMPAFTKLNAADCRLVALLRSAVAAVACERCRLKTGRFPKSLAELPKDLLSAIPDDPYTGTPLLLRTTETGLVVYSAGKDLKDDGGNLSTTAKDEPGTDIGFTLLDPKYRRSSGRP